MVPRDPSGREDFTGSYLTDRWDSRGAAINCCVGNRTGFLRGSIPFLLRRNSGGSATLGLYRLSALWFNMARWVRGAEPRNVERRGEREGSQNDRQFLRGGRPGIPSGARDVREPGTRAQKGSVF